MEALSNIPKRIEKGAFHMPHRIAALIEQFAALKSMMLASIAALIGGAHVTFGDIINVFSNEPVRDSTSAWCLLFAGAALGGFISTQFTSERSALLNLPQWTRRIVMAAGTSVVLSPFILIVLQAVNPTIYGVTITIEPSPPVILTVSAVVAILSKRIIRKIQTKGKDIINDDD